MTPESPSSLNFVILETTRRCNLRCIHCAVSEENNQGSYAWEDLSIETFRKVLPMLEAHKPWVQLSGHGETLLHPHFLEMLESTLRAGCKVRFQTNGTVMTKALAEAIVQNGVEIIVVSLDAATPQLFEKIRRRASLARIFRNLEMIREMKQRSGVDRPMLQIEFVAMRQNIHELPEVVTLAGQLGADTMAVTELKEYPLTVGQSQIDEAELAEWARQAQEEAQEWGINLILPPTVVRALNGAEASPEPSAPTGPRVDPNDPSSYRGLRKTCREPWERLFVQYDGNIWPCCWITESYGNLTSQSFDEVWQSDRYRALREAVLTDRPPPSCVHCPVYGWEPLPEGAESAQNERHEGPDRVHLPTIQ